MHVPESADFNKATEGLGHFVFAWDLFHSGSTATLLLNFANTGVYFSWCFVLALQIGPCKTHHVGTSLLCLKGDREHWVPAPLFVPVLPAHLQEGREQPDSGCAHFFLRVGLMGWVTCACTVFLSSTALLPRVLQAKGVLGYYLHFQEDKVAVELLQANQTCWRQ